MSITIGPIVIKDVENLKWSTRRQNDIVSIPYGHQINSVTGVELVEYQFSGSIFSDTVAPKLLRRQLTELFENSSRDFTYIEFSEDSNELTGWFLLDSFSTAIISSTFHYSFDMTVRRLSLGNSQMIALYAQDDIPLITDYSLTPAIRRWVAMPKGQGDSSHLLRTGDEGTTRVVIDSLVHYMPYEQTNIINDFRCRVYDTTAKGSLEFFVNSSNLIESGWEERYGLGNNFQGDAVISNGLIRVVFFNPRSITSPGNYDIHIWSGSKWEWGCRDFTPVIRETTPVYNLSVFEPPTITYFSNNEIKFIQWFTNSRSIFFGVKNTLSFGSYFVSKELVTKPDILSQFSTVSGHFTKGYTNLGSSSSVINDNYVTIQFQTGTGFNFNMGILYTRIPTPTTGGVNVFLGDTIPINTRYQLGVFLLPNPPPSGTSLANIGREYLSGSTQKRVLINPKWM